MSALAQKLPTPGTSLQPRVRRGPSSACDIYGPGDLEDWAAVERLRLVEFWSGAQRQVDKALGVTASIDEGKFRYHWRKKCFHWTEDQRRTTLEDLA